MQAKAESSRLAEDHEGTHRRVRRTSGNPCKSEPCVLLAAERSPKTSETARFFSTQVRLGSSTARSSAGRVRRTTTGIVSIARTSRRPGPSATGAAEVVREAVVAKRARSLGSAAGRVGGGHVADLDFPCLSELFVLLVGDGLPACLGGSLGPLMPPVQRHFDRCSGGHFLATGQPSGSLNGL